MTIAIAIVVLSSTVGVAVAAADTPTHLQDIPAALEKGTMERRDERTHGRFEIEIDALEPTAGETTAKVRVKNLADFALEDLELICTAFDERENELAALLAPAGVRQRLDAAR